jgi:PAS domain S-box-containing protein
MADRILIVEDERITAEDLREVLTGLGYDVTAVVSSGAEAVLEVERNPPDLALMDIRIQGAMDGTETATILRERFDIPVIFLTAHADRTTLDRAKQSRPVGYVVKPYQESELQASVEIALHKHRFDRKTRSRQQQLTDVVGSMILAIISVDLNELVGVFNPAAEDLTGWSKSEALQRPLRRVFRLADQVTGIETDLPLRDVMQGNAMVELRNKLLITRTGERVSIEGNIAPVRGVAGSYSGAVIVFESVAALPEDRRARPLASISEKNGALEFGRFQVIAASDKMRQALAFAQRVARSEASVVLLEGESGTGKDLIAQFLHYSGSRSSRPFVPINCSAIPDTLMESELFGHEPGAFSDARTQKKGLLEVANGGTLFLDEIGEMSPVVQTKLLRVLETQSFRRLGGVRDIEVDVRVVSATNRLLAEAVHADRFRLDLFHRLSIIQITLPALRDRVEDILPLARHFVRELALKYKVTVEGISPAAARALEAHDWPGNVRELRNVIERAVLSETSDMIQASNLRFVSSSKGIHIAGQGDLSLKNSQRNLIQQALEKTGGNKTKAALLLGISRDVLRYRMNKLKLGDGSK